MAITSNQRAYLTARFGAMRFGAFRFGFTPKDTRGKDAGDTSGPYYTWQRDYPPQTSSWTTDKR